MMKKNLILLTLIIPCILFSPTARAVGAGDPEGNPDDPAYALYRKGYNLILEEKWKAAREVFSKLVKSFPASEYFDDAEYWTAYSYRDESRKKAVESYKKFLGAHKDSKYFDDALADFDQLLATPVLIRVPELNASRVTRAAPAAPRDAAPPSRISITSLPSPALAPVMKIRHLERMLRGGLRGSNGFMLRDDRDRDLDPDTRIRLEALNAVARAGEDDRSFGTLKKAALDRAQLQVIRISAIEALSRFEKHDVLPIFLDIARNDTSEEMQLFAIDYIGSAAGSKENAFNALMDLYGSLPTNQPEKRKMVFYSIAEVGGDRSIEFLAKVARSHEDYELRREAIYYLGSIGGEKSRAVLYEILDVK